MNMPANAPAMDNPVTNKIPPRPPGGKWALSRTKGSSLMMSGVERGLLRTEGGSLMMPGVKLGLSRTDQESQRTSGAE